MRRLRRASAAIGFSLLVLLGGSGGLNLSAVDIAAAPYRYDLVSWEVSHFLDKWEYKINSVFPWKSRSRQEKLRDLQEFFEMGDEIRALERELLAGLQVDSSHNPSVGDSSPITGRGEELNSLLRRLDSLRSERSGMKPGVEETLESEVSAALVEEGLGLRFGLIFPPVDVALSTPPRLLVLSPRGKIERVKTLLLKPNMRVEDMEALEERILEDVDLAALVTGIGGVATYPTLVRSDSSLRRAAITASHEWLHAYWFFRPLGWNYSSSPQMTTLNETAADLAGKVLGERVYQAITAEKIEPPAPTGNAADDLTTAGHGTGDQRATFDFNREMRKTRLRVDELLAQGNVEEAEAYMEERRKLFVANGFHIRKLNQAYFAFHGTYASNPASVSPIGRQIKQLRGLSDSVGDFIRTVARFASYREFREYLSERPNPSPTSWMNGTGDSDYPTVSGSRPRIVVLTPGPRPLAARALP